MKSIRQVRIDCDRIAARTNKLKLGKRDAALLRKTIAELDGLCELVVEYSCLFEYRLTNTPRSYELSLDPAVVAKMALDNNVAFAEALHPNKDLQDEQAEIRLGTIIKPPVG